MKKQVTLIYYYVPEDKDDSSVPNVFEINVKKDDLRLKHLYEYFPIIGQYIFRFKVLYENHIAWLDLPDLHAKLPTYKDKIMIKASRTSWQNQKNTFETAKSATNINSKPQTNEQTPNIHPKNIKSVQTKHLSDQNGTSSAKKLPEQKKSQNFNLIDDQYLHTNPSIIHHQQNNKDNDSLL